MWKVQQCRHPLLWCLLPSRSPCSFLSSSSFSLGSIYPLLKVSFWTAWQYRIGVISFSFEVLSLFTLILFTFPRLRIKWLFLQRPHQHRLIWDLQRRLNHLQRIKLHSFKFILSFWWLLLCHGEMFLRRFLSWGNILAEVLLLMMWIVKYFHYFIVKAYEAAQDFEFPFQSLNYPVYLR